MDKEEFRKYLLKGEESGTGFTLTVPDYIFNGGAGLKLSNRSGSSLDFMEHRDYLPGDDLRQLDWSVYARSDKLAVKLYREEVNPRLDILIDGSASMGLQDSMKAEATLMMSAFLAAAAGNASFMTRCWVSRETIVAPANNSAPPSAWGDFAFDSSASPLDAINNFYGRFQFHGIRILVSDLIWGGSPEAFLQRFAQDSSMTIIVQLLAKHDIEPPEGNIRLQDSETGEIEEFFLDAANIANYKRTLARHQENWLRACREYGAVFCSFCAEDLMEKWDVSELLRRQILNVI
jgi:uncharacterized protein (DUF58 family)